MSQIDPIRITRISVATSRVPLLLGLGARAKTRQTRSTETRGFLGDYSQLREDETGLVGLKEWSQVRRIMDVWLGNLRERLSELRGVAG